MQFLMICHDQDIDRRILHQATALRQEGWGGSIVCLSHDCDDREEIIESGVVVHRIGLSRIVPSCPMYQLYHCRQQRILRWVYTKPHQFVARMKLPIRALVDRVFSLSSRINRYLYRMNLCAYYHNTRFFSPFPFDSCFYEAACRYSPDIVIAHDLPALPAASRFARERGVPLVYDAHELYYEQRVFSRKQKRIMRGIESKLIHDCSAVFTVNESIAAEMARRYGCPKPHVLLNVTDAPEDFSPNVKHRRLRRHFNLPKDVRILLFQGGLLASRNLETVARAMQFVRYPKAVLVFMGNGPFRARLEQTVSKLGIQERVLFKDAVPQAELISWTASADLGIVPYPAVDLNTRFCTPNKLFEYIQASVPILANDLPELRHFVRETRFGKTVPMDNPSVIAAEIDSCLQDNLFYTKARAELLRRRGEFSWAAAKGSYIEVIGGVFDTSPPKTVDVTCQLSNA